MPLGVPRSMKYSVLLYVVRTRMSRRSAMPLRSPVHGWVMLVRAMPRRPFSMGAWARRVMTALAQSASAAIARSRRLDPMTAAAFLDLNARSRDLFRHHTALKQVPLDLQQRLRIDTVEHIEDDGDQAGPSGLMAGP